MNAARCLLLSCVTALVGVSGLLAQPAGRAEALALKLQQHYDGIKDFEADFIQTVRGGVLPTKSVGEGHLFVKKPGRMRWVYSKPERQELIWDGLRAISYSPDDKHAIESEAPADGSAALLFLAGRGNILRDFTPSIAPSTAPGTVGLKLTPRQAEPDFDHFTVVLDEKSTQLRSLVWRDGQGGETTTEFRNLKENAGIPDRLVVFTPPRGVEVITAGPQRP